MDAIGSGVRLLPTRPSRAGMSVRHARVTSTPNESLRSDPNSPHAHPKSLLRSAGWVPERAGMTWDAAATEAVAWILERSAAEGIAPLLVTQTRGGGIPQVLQRVSGHGHATPQSRGSFGVGPVLAYVPEARALSFAMSRARGHSLAVVEGNAYPLNEWAAAVGALGLLTGVVTESQLDAEVVADLESTIFYGGNNGWSGSDEKRHVRTHLGAPVRAGRLEPDDAAAFVLGRGVSHHGADRIDQILRSA